VRQEASNLQALSSPPPGALTGGTCGAARPWSLRKGKVSWRGATRLRLCSAADCVEQPTTTWSGLGFGFGFGSKSG
jgi:hypothetical protein